MFGQFWSNSASAKSGEGRYSTVCLHIDLQRKHLLLSTLFSAQLQGGLVWEASCELQRLTELSAESHNSINLNDCNSP